MMEIRRGDIFYIEKRNDTVGHEQWSGRPGIVVSNDTLNRAENTVEIVYLTTQPKKQSPLHVPIHALGRTSTALCEQIWTTSVERLQSKGENIGDQIREIDRALMVSLGLDGKSVAEPAERPMDMETVKETIKNARGNWNWRAKYEVLRELYDNLVERVVG